MTENDEQELNKLLAKPGSELIKDILEYNQISSLVLSGVLTVNPGSRYGYFKSVVDHNGRKIKYPNGDDIDEVFIYDPYELEKGERYYFECELEKNINERRKRNNPYLLKTTVDRVQQGEKLNSLVKAIEEKNYEINELNETIKYCEETIAQKITEISKNESFISELSEKIESNKIQLDQIINQKTEMENTIKILQQKINICRKLEFLNEDEERQYISLSREKYVIRSNYLSFENELESSFAKLADHVHQYLFCEKNLARVEYYFADFLSKLEERSNQPEIELYAKHEEELFISEFKTLLNLLENSAKDIENYDIYENRYLCLMLNSIYKIVSNNINYTKKQLESLEFKINDKKAKIKVLNDPNPQVNKEEIIEEILLQEKKVQNIEKEWRKISQSVSSNHQAKYKDQEKKIKLQRRKKQSNDQFWCETERTKEKDKNCLISFPREYSQFLKEWEEYSCIVSFDIVDDDDCIKVEIVSIKKIEPCSERNRLIQYQKKREELESNNWVQIVTPKDIKERENQVKTLENDIKKLEKQIKDLDEFVKEQQKLLPLIEQRRKKTFFKTIKWQNIQGFTPSMTFIQNISYRNALNSYKEILKSEGIDLEVFDLYEKATTYGVREIPQVYELWCLVSIIKTLKEPYGFKYNSRDIRTLLKVINPENNNLNNQVTINFEENLNGRTITLYYQKTLPNNKRPDFLLEISINDRKIYLVLDAKFKNYNYKKSLNYEIKNLNDKYSDMDYYVFILHPCNDLTGENKPVKMTNHGGDKIYFGEEEDQKPTFPFHKYGYITHKPNFTDNLKKLIGMAFEYLLESNKNAKNGNIIDPKPNNDLFCLNCGSTSVNLHPKQGAKKYTADCRTCGHQTHINYCWNCSTKLFKHGYYWDYHKTSVWSSFDIHCPNCGMAFADKPTMKLADK